MLGFSTTKWDGKPGHPEYLMCEVVPRCGGCEPFFVAVVYRPPREPFKEGTDFVPKITEHMHNYSTKIILGDFNADQLSSSEDAKFLRSFIEENSLFSVPFGATHHTATSDTWLNLYFVDTLDTVLSHWKSDSPFIASYDLVIASLRLNV